MLCSSQKCAYNHWLKAQRERVERSAPSARRAPSAPSAQRSVRIAVTHCVSASARVSVSSSNDNKIERRKGREHYS